MSTRCTLRRRIEHTVPVPPSHTSGQEFVDRQPSGRPGTPEEVARAILWLLSAEASYASGTFIDVTGGIA